MSNRLAAESSPYLLQHAENPVDWYPWGQEAFDRARAEDKPVFLSVGYSACHWCHVMEHESFEDPATAALMNERFVSIKVDREERPDVDAIYMDAVQALTGRGGWPLSAFLTPDAVPFYGGTYIPSTARYGSPSFTDVLTQVAALWETRRRELLDAGEKLRAVVEQSAASGETAADALLDPATLDAAVRGLSRTFDGANGGWGGAPKFPQPSVIEFLLRRHHATADQRVLEMVTRTLDAMMRGGIYDQLGGGFHRYSTDEMWLVPHFEKMLYDNALLVRLGAHLWQATGDAEVHRVTHQTIAWIAREMTSPEGGFYSSLDADSEGHEGRYYVWDSRELETLLGEDASLLVAYWGVTQEGNFEGRNILHVPRHPDAFANAHGVTLPELRTAIDRAERILLDAREQRIRPARDEKILTGWNGLMLRGIAEAARVFDDAELAAMAVRSGEFLFGTLVREGRVMRSYKDGIAKIPGFLEDHAALGLAAIALYNLTFDRGWLDRAKKLGDEILARFWDEETQAFFDTAADGEQLVTRPRDVTDNAMPSGTSLTIELLLILGDLFAHRQYTDRATHMLETIAEPMARYPTAFGHALGAADMAVRGAIEVAIAGSPTDVGFRELALAVAGRYVPSLVLAGGAGSAADGIELLKDRERSEPTAFVCRANACGAPTRNPSELVAQLKAAR